MPAHSILEPSDWAAIRIGYAVKTMVNHRGRINRFKRYVKDLELQLPVTRNAAERALFNVHLTAPVCFGD